MRPALERLLSRPSSLEFLRHFVAPSAPITTAKRKRNTSCFNQIEVRAHTTLAADAQAVELPRYDGIYNSPIRPVNPALVPLKANPPRVPSRREKVETPANTSTDFYWLYNEEILSHEQLELESELDANPRKTKERRLLNEAGHREDFKLWACVLDLQQRRHGDSGTLNLWNAIRSRRICLPTEGYLADRFWLAFLDLGFRQPDVLGEVLQYADEVVDAKGSRWARLYVYVMQHFLVHDPDQAVHMHERLFKHPPAPSRFREMCHKVVFRGGDLKRLRLVYGWNTPRNIYTKVVPVLCDREDFVAALDWHQFFLRHGDLPPTSKAVEPLIHFLAVYYPKKAVQVTKSLADAGVSFTSAVSEKLEHNTKLSREMMNMIHGKTLNVDAKAYNDNLGARWFASSWVSVDVAITAVHALGVNEIGPLSLQAIAIREPDAKSIILRINQLRGLGISIGQSLFSRAVEHFARMRKYDLLDTLLQSDQHPDALEDTVLQEALLTQYALNKDWAQYRRAFEIRLLASKSPEIERLNLVLRRHITTGNMTAIHSTLYQMRDEGKFVKPSTISHLLRFILRPRQRGRRPMTLKNQRNVGQHNDLNLAIAIMKSIMGSGSYVPALAWREILRRLGMLGRFADLQDLCIYLASWYGATDVRKARYRVPTQIPSWHPLHPLQQLFPDSLQIAIIEWGFIHALKRKSAHLASFRSILPEANRVPDVTAGILLLQKLQAEGVHVNSSTVRKALLNRLITYFGPGESNKPYNQYAKQRLQGKLRPLVVQIDQALGQTYFTNGDIDLEGIVRSKGAIRWNACLRQKRRNLDTSRAIAAGRNEGTPSRLGLRR